MLRTCTGMALDREQRIWVTTRNSGLVCIDAGGTITAYLKNDVGNIIDEQHGIAADESGRLWLFAGSGLYRFDPEKTSFTQFTMQDGIPYRSLSHLSYSGKDSSIVYVIHEGVYRFFPRELASESNPPQVFLNSILVNGQGMTSIGFVGAATSVQLLHTENNITVEFAAVNFTNPWATLYSCFLEGIDKQWSPPVRARVINYSQLAPGDYRLHIRAGIGAVKEGSPERILRIVIVPAWWQTAWFRWAVALICVAGIVWIVRFFLSIRYRQRIVQLERQREIEAMRTRISRDIHDEIGSGLTKIKLMSRNLMKTTDSSGDLSRKISATSDELIQNMGEIVWTINPANDSLENVVAYIRNYLSRLFEENPEITVQLALPEPSQIPTGRSINPEVKRNLILIVKEAITNIVKHSKATEVVVTLVTEASEIKLGIRDNGKGMAVNLPGEHGNGLRNMRNRAEAIRAKFEVDSGPGRGTSIHLVIPV